MVSTTTATEVEASSAPGEQAGEQTEEGEGLVNRNSAEADFPPLPGGQKFVVSRLFLFDRMLLVTEEVKPKRKGTTIDAFAQSTYQFRAAVNVNKMKFEVSFYFILNTPSCLTVYGTLS